MTWIFGYGSLIWRPAFAFDLRRKALLRGWQRRFWQASTDHRGVPAAPGRVVTLMTDPQARCWGVAYRADRETWPAILAELDHREQNGYARVSVEIEFEDGARTSALTYIAGADNPSFIGPASVIEMAHQIMRARGPSGSNREYLDRLVEQLALLDVHDQEVSDLHGALADLARAS